LRATIFGFLFLCAVTRAIWLFIDPRGVFFVVANRVTASTADALLPKIIRVPRAQQMYDFFLLSIGFCSSKYISVCGNIIFLYDECGSVYLSHFVRLFFPARSLYSTVMSMNTELLSFWVKMLTHFDTPDRSTLLDTSYKFNSCNDPKSWWQKLFRLLHILPWLWYFTVVLILGFINADLFHIAYTIFCAFYMCAVYIIVIYSYKYMYSKVKATESNSLKLLTKLSLGMLFYFSVWLVVVLIETSVDYFWSKQPLVKLVASIVYFTLENIYLLVILYVIPVPALLRQKKKGHARSMELNRTKSSSSNRSLKNTSSTSSVSSQTSSSNRAVERRPTYANTWLGDLENALGSGKYTPKFTAEKEENEAVSEGDGRLDFAQMNTNPMERSASSGSCGSSKSGGGKLTSDMHDKTKSFELRLGRLAQSKHSPKH
jgi:hypothetical protein